MNFRKQSILRNYTHSSDIILQYIELSDRSFYRKSSFESTGIDSLRREFSGFQWYLSSNHVAYEPNYVQFRDFNAYALLDIPSLPFKRLPLYLNHRQFSTYLSRAIHHYAKVWPSLHADLIEYPIHGDFSLDGNILFGDRDLFVLDWEHFNPKVGPLGFDLLYMLYEIIIIRYRHGIPNTHFLKTISEALAYASSLNLIDATVFLGKNYLSRFLEYQRSISILWGNQYHKLPTNLFTPDQVKFIDAYLNELHV